jgi:thiol-disulfide isomerase/thioredoxin
MTSRRALGVVAVLMLVAAVWAAARAVRRPDGLSPEPAAAPSSATGEKIALQFYRDPAPVGSIAMADLDGHAISSADWHGKVVIINFWATWCPPCRAEMPDLVKWQREYRGRDLQVIGITYPPTERREVRQFIRSIKVNYPILLGSIETKALFEQGETLPITVVIDREGNIQDLIEGILLPEEFEQKIKPLLR